MANKYNLFYNFRSCRIFYLIKEPGSLNETFLTISSIVNAPVMFLTTKMIFERIRLKKAVNKIITEVGKCRFGVYLIHILILWKIPVF